MKDKIDDRQMALAGLDGLEAKGLEITHRAKITRQAIESGQSASMEFFLHMLLESARAAEFWAGLVEKHRRALFEAHQGDASPEADGE